MLRGEARMTFREADRTTLLVSFAELINEKETKSATFPLP